MWKSRQNILDSSGQKFVLTRIHCFLSLTMFTPFRTFHAPSFVCLSIVINSRTDKKDGFLLSPIDKEDIPLTSFYLDHVGLLTITRKQYNYIKKRHKYWCGRLTKQEVMFGNSRRIILIGAPHHITYYWKRKQTGRAYSWVKISSTPITLPREAQK